MFPAVVRIADQLSTDGINYPIEEFQWHLPNKDGTIVGHFEDIDDAIAALDRESHCLVHSCVNNARTGPNAACSESLQAKLLDEALGKREHHGPGVNHGVRHLDAPYLICLKNSLFSLE